MRKRPRKRALAPGQAEDAEAAGQAAVVLLARRDYCAHELEEALQARGFAAEAVSRTLLDLAERGYLNDERYAERYVALHAERGSGPLRIRRELTDLGITDALAEAALSAIGDWQRRARELRIRRFGPDLPGDWPGRARQARFLQYRGFSNDHIRAALGSEVIEDLT